ncbi:MAG: hypothetical protein LQ338_001129 [Usnochroma carphineum]|nr:MAG: hypothetical protein LQ338_001129 [Usnochroma carphineum]
MKFSSSPRSFALLGLSFISLESSLSLSIDSKAGILEPRLDGYASSALSPSSIPFASPTRRRKTKCSGAGTGVASGTYPTGSGLSPSPQNGTTLASTLPYPKSSGAAISLPPAASSSNGDSPIEPTVSSGCGQSTVTVTSVHTVTVIEKAGQSPILTGLGDVSTTGSATAAPQSDVAVPPASVIASSGLLNGNGSTSITAPTASPSNGNFTSRTSSIRLADEAPLSSKASSANITLAKTKTSSTVTYDAIGSSTHSSPSSKTSELVASVGGGSSAIANQTSTKPSNHTGEFWAGADIDTVLRAEALRGRTFYDYDGKTVKDPIKTLGDAGLNAFRVETFRGMCLGPKPFVNNATSLADELLFKLDFGCISTKVETAKQAKAAGMKKMQLTINQGFNIPQGMEKYTYAQMVQEVQKETKRQLQPFLDAGIVPDIILFENEGSDGFLFHEEATGHDRGQTDGKASPDTINQELCGQIPTGLMNSYPQMSGYLKAEVVACNDAIKAAGFPAGSVRYGLHSHGQYVQWKESVVHGPDRPSQTNLTKLDKSPCDEGAANPIPSDLLAMDVAEILTIAGFSAYPDPMRPSNIDSPASLRATLSRLNDTLIQLQGYTKTFPKLQALGVEYATRFKPSEMAQQRRHTEIMWALVKGFPSFLGMMWWEPWYCRNDWEGGEATLCRLEFGQGDVVGETPTGTLRSWGEGAG